MRRIELAWLAGFIDGEGCINASMRINERSIHPSYSVILLVGNTDIKLLEHCQRITGLGSITEKKFVTPRPNWKPAWQWAICSNNAIGLLRKVYPYLVSKRPQVDVVIKLQEAITKSNRGKMSDSDYRHRKELYEALRELKHN